MRRARPATSERPSGSGTPSPASEQGCSTARRCRARHDSSAWRTTTTGRFLIISGRLNPLKSHIHNVPGFGWYGSAIEGDATGLRASRSTRAARRPIRVCQPRPPALKCSITSRESRMVVDIFGLALGGRPRRTATRANFSGQPSAARSGAVSGSKSRSVECAFPLIGLPHADNPTPAVARRPDEDDHIASSRPRAREGGRALRRVEGDRHDSCYYVKSVPGGKQDVVDPSEPKSPARPAGVRSATPAGLPPSAQPRVRSNSAMNATRASTAAAGQAL